MSDDNKFDDGWELDLGEPAGGSTGGGAIVPPPPSSSAIVPPPPGGRGMAPPAGAQRYYVKRSSGKVFGPFLEKAILSMLEQNKLSGAEQVSLDSQNWAELADVPTLAPYARRRQGGGPNLPRATPVGGVNDVMDLPGLPGANRPQGIIDLPGLPSARGAPSPAAPAPGGRGAGIDLSDFDASPGPSALRQESPGEFDFDAPDDGDVLDLLAPVGYQQDVTDLLAPKGPRPGLPLAGSRGGLPELTDLPAPKGHADLTDLLTPKLGQAGMPNHGAEQRARGGTGLEYGQLELGNDDVSLELDDLPMPSDGVTGLPRPRDGVTGLPRPRDGVTGLLTPAGQTGLLTPAGQTDLLRPAGQTGLLRPVGGIDLPTPAQTVGLPRPVGGIDLPMPADSSGLLTPSGAIDYPTPAIGQTGLPGGTIDLPTPAGGGAGRSDMLRPKGTAGSHPHIDVVAPKQYGDDEIVRFEAPSSGELETRAAADMAVDADLDALDSKKKRGRKRPTRGKAPMMIGVGAGVFVIVAGLAMGLLTDYGFFGINLITGKSTALSKARNALRSGRVQLRRDTLDGYRLAHDAFVSVRKSVSPEDAKSLQAQALLARVVRFGPNVAIVNQANTLIASLATVAEPKLELQKARALFKLADGKTTEAIANLRLISDREPSDPETAIYLGWAQLKTGQLATARAAFKRALAADPKLPAALFGAARVELRLNNTQQAKTHIDRGLAVAANHPGLLLLSGDLIAAKQPKAALLAWQRVAKMPPRSAAVVERSAAHTRIGELASKEGRSDQARTRFRAALQIRPRNARAHLGLGKLHFAAGANKDALDHFTKAQRPGHREATIMIARAHLAMGKTLDARQVLVQLAKTAPRDAQIRFLLGRSEEAHDEAGAIKHYEASIKLKPAYFEPYYQLSKVYLRKKKTTDAFATLEQASSAMPASALVRNAIGEAHLAMQAFDKAFKAFQEALAIDGNLNRARFNLAGTLFKQGKLEESLKGYEELKLRDARFPGLAGALGDLYLQTKRFKLAAAEFDKAVLVDNPEPATRLSAAKAFIAAGQFKKSLKQSETVLRDQPTMAAARALRAEARLGQGQLGEALVEIRQALDREKRTDFFEVQARILEQLGRTGEATDSYKQALKLAPKRVDLRLKRAKLLIKGGAVKDGLREIDAVIRREPERGDAYLYRGIALADLGKERDARAAFETAVKKDATLGEAHLRLGQILSDTHRYPAAATHLELAVKYASGTARWRAEAWYLLGTVSHKRGANKRAKEALITFLEVAKKVDPARAVATKTLRSLGWKPPKKPED